MMTARCIFVAIKRLTIAFLFILVVISAIFYFFSPSSDEAFTQHPSSLRDYRLHVLNLENFSRFLVPTDSYSDECFGELSDKTCAYELQNRVWQGQLHEETFTEDEFFDTKRIVLIVQFNDPHYVAASKTYYLYSRLFGEVVFCGPDDDEAAFWPKSEWARVNNSLVSVPESTKFLPMGKPTKNQGENAYYCISLLMEQYNHTLPLNFDGVLLVADDTIPHVWNWNLTGKSLHKNWLIDHTFDYYAFEVDQGAFCWELFTSNTLDCHRFLMDWWLWQDIFHDNCLHFYNELEKLAEMDAYWKQIANNLVRVTGGRRRLYRGSADMFYIARQFLPVIIPIFNLMSKHRVFMEIGVPTAIRAVSLDGNLQILDRSGYDWGAGPIRRHPLITTYRTGYEFLHPFKMGFVFRNKTQSFVVNESALIQGGLSRGNFNQESNNRYDCLYCYLRVMFTSYSTQFSD